jgi:hypothetical protein
MGETDDDVLRAECQPREALAHGAPGGFVAEGSPGTQPTASPAGP